MGWRSPHTPRPVPREPGAQPAAPPEISSAARVPRVPPSRLHPDSVPSLGPLVEFPAVFGGPASVRLRPCPVYHAGSKRLRLQDHGQLPQDPPGGQRPPGAHPDTAHPIRCWPPTCTQGTGPGPGWDSGSASRMAFLLTTLRVGPPRASTQEGCQVPPLATLEPPQSAQGPAWVTVAGRGLGPADSCLLVSTAGHEATSGVRAG